MRFVDIELIDNVSIGGSLDRAASLVSQRFKAALSDGRD
jgi:hypothetical protein